MAWMTALEAAEAAVSHLKRALAEAQVGTGNAWKVRGNWNEAIRHLQLALDQCRDEGRLCYHIERDADGKPVRLWWIPPR